MRKINRHPREVGTISEEMRTKKKTTGELGNQNLNVKNELQESHLPAIQFETVFEDSMLGNKIIDSNLRILRVNKAIVKLLGYTVEELLGKRILEISHPDHRKRWRYLQKELWKRNSPSFSIEACIVRKDRSFVWCHVMSILFANGTETLGYTIIEDISERKAREIANARISARKDEFLSVLTHELNTPLTNIKALNQILQRQFSGDGMLSGFIQRTGYQIDRLQRLISDLLDVTKIRSGNLNLITTEFNIRELLVDSISDVQSIAPKHHIVLEFSPDLIYNGDRFRLEQVMINLLTNAVKYSPEVSQILVRSWVEERKVVIAIQDFGMGIPEPEIGKITDRFYRVNKTSTGHQGLGLGLYISLGIIRKHHGDFWIKSEQGKGSTFYFSLPLEAQELP
ncbi:MAG TPA: PAS domain-containing sensor histidine kinase [Sphingobacteriaceae bacterium]